jgi:hypothetical protein
MARQTSTISLIGSPIAVAPVFGSAMGIVHAKPELREQQGSLTAVASLVSVAAIWDISCLRLGPPAHFRFEADPVAMGLQ